MTTTNHRSTLAPRARRDGRRAGREPVSLRVSRRRVLVDGTWSATLVITGLPAHVTAGWLTPLTTHPALVDVALHIEPIPPVAAATRLRRRLARLESGRRHDAEHGRLLDPQVEAATADAHELAARLAQGETRLFTLTATLTVRALDAARLAEDLDALTATASSMLITTHPTGLREIAAWHTSLPLGRDRLGDRRVLDTDSLAASFPFANPDLPPPRHHEPTPGDRADTGANTGAGAGTGGAVLLGDNLSSAGLLWWDRWALDNHNAVVLGRSGAGKSYLLKVELLRNLYTGVHAHVIDPEDEYTRLAAAIGATVIRPGAPGVRINPLDLDVHTNPATGTLTAARDALTRRRLHLHTVIAVLLGVDLDPGERAVLDAALTATYTRAGITPDPATWSRPAPQLADLHHTLTQTENAAGAADPISARVAGALAAKMRPFVGDGAWADLFAGPSTSVAAGALVVWSLRELPDELKAVGTLLCLDAIWRQVTHPHDRRRRMVLVDEAWLLLTQPAAAGFLLRLAKAGRKHWAGLTLATQDTGDLLASDLGHAVVANAATQILLRQAPQAIDRVHDVFDLTGGERRFLLTAERGHALLCAGTHRAVFHTTASPREDHLATTTPQRLLDHAHHQDWIPLHPHPPTGTPHNPTAGSSATPSAGPWPGPGPGMAPRSRPPGRTEGSANPATSPATNAPTLELPVVTAAEPPIDQTGMDEAPTAPIDTSAIGAALGATVRQAAHPDHDGGRDSSGAEVGAGRAGPRTPRERAGEAGRKPPGDAATPTSAGETSAGEEWAS